jgi:hypothetical protein
MGGGRKKSKKPSGTKAERLLSQTVFFVDYSLGKHVAEVLRAAGLTVHFHTDCFAEDAEDNDWIGQVGERGWIVLTKDKSIRRVASEREAVIRANVGMFTLASGNMTGEEMAAIFRDNRLDMARFILRNSPPFIASVTRTGVTLVHPQPPAEPPAAST